MASHVCVCVCVCVCTQVQREWLEAAVSDLGQGHLDAAALLKMQVCVCVCDHCL